MKVSPLRALTRIFELGTLSLQWSVEMKAGGKRIETISGGYSSIVVEYM